MHAHDLSSLYHTKGGQCARAWATRKRSLKAKGVSDVELQNLEQPCSYLKAQQRDERSASVSKGKEPKAKWKVKLGESPPFEDVKMEKKRLEEENGGSSS